MRGSLRTSTEIYDSSGGNNSIVEQTTDIINRFRHSIVRSRQERLLDEDVQATDNIVNQLHLSELISKETLGKLISQGDSMQRSYRLINQLEKEIKEIADDLNEVKGGKCWGACTEGSFFGFTCFGCLNRRKKKKNQQRYPDELKTKEQNFDQNRGVELEESMAKTRGLSRERREHPDFLQVLNQLEETKRIETETNDKKLTKLRDYLLQDHSLSYGYIDQPDRLMNEINMAIHFTQLNTHLDHLLQITDIMNNEVNKHNIVISKIEAQAMESGNLLTDYTLLGHNILGSSPTQLQTLPNTNTALGMSTGQKILLNSVL
jgi:hypothetical protein